MQETSRKPILAITTGDPAGIGPEIVFRALERIESSVPIRIHGSWELTQAPLKEAGVEPGIPVIPVDEADESDDRIAFIDLGRDAGTNDFSVGKESRAGGAAALAAIDSAVSSIERGSAAALVTGPISKSAIRLAGESAPGHTELLATRAGLERYAHDYAMYFDSPSLRVALLTVHIPLSDVPGRIEAESVAALAQLVNREIRRFEGLDPRIAVAGLNPHAGEGGMFGREEERIADGIVLARAKGLNVEGPVPADTVFHSAIAGKFDAVIAMYHDQGLIPIKTLHFREAVNVTLGLPYIRASVDHGTAFDIAGKGVADPTGMKFAIEWALERMVP